MHEMIQYRRHGEDAAEDTDNLDEQCVPFAVAVYVEHRHRVGLVSE